MLNLRIGLLLGLRQIQRTSPWTTILIVSVILFTFLNLIVVSGILIGIVDGAVRQNREQAYGDIIIKPLPDETRILETDRVLQELATYPEIASYTAHDFGLATLEANYRERRDMSSDPDVIAVTLTGINPVQEDKALSLSSLVVEGEYFKPEESGYILIGKHHIDRYEIKFGDIYPSVKHVYPGDKVRVTVGTKMEEFTVKGIVDSKIDLVSLSVYIPEKEFRRLYDRADYNVNQILVRLKPGYAEASVNSLLNESDIRTSGEIKTFSESTPKFVSDVATTFETLSIIVGGIGIAVASITVFIIVFINVLSRRRQIGILKAIGISERAIQFAYVVQAGFYTILGSILGVYITLYLLVPYFIKHPIDFPYSDVSLSISASGMLSRCFILLIMTLIAGFFPAWLIVRENTINAILGRK